MLTDLAKLRACSLSEKELCARFLLLHLARVHGGNWLSGPRKPCTSSKAQSFVDELDLHLRERQRLKISPLASAQEVFKHFYLRGVVLDSHEGFVGWSEGHYPLEVLNRIPTPEEMLDIQCEGKRYVSLLLEDEEQLRVYGRHKDAAAFLLHDFEHAHKFFGCETYVGQRRFFNLLRRNLKSLEEWSDDQRFVKDLAYLKSDMNSHPVHLLKYLKAIVLTAAMRKTGSRNPELNDFWRGFFGAWEMSLEETDSAMNLNQPALETIKDQVRAYDFFAKEARG